MPVVQGLAAGLTAVAAATSTSMVVPQMPLYIPTHTGPVIPVGPKLETGNPLPFVEASVADLLEDGQNDMQKRQQIPVVIINPTPGPNPQPPVYYPVPPPAQPVPPYQQPSYQQPPYQPPPAQPPYQQPPAQQPPAQQPPAPQPPAQQPPAQQPPAQQPSPPPAAPPQQPAPTPVKPAPEEPNRPIKPVPPPSKPTSPHDLPEEDVQRNPGLDGRDRRH